MQMMQVHDYARRLYEAHGDRAELEAAQKATALEAAGDKAQAETWRRVQRSIKEMRGGKVG